MKEVVCGCGVRIRIRIFQFFVFFIDLTSFIFVFELVRGYFCAGWLQISIRIFVVYAKAAR